MQKDHACRQAGFAHILLIVLIAGIISIGGVAYFISAHSLEVETEEVKAVDQGLYLKPIQTVTKKVISTPTASLEPKINRYTNLNLGFQFEYPSKLTVKLDSEEEFSKRNLGDFRENFNYRAHYYPEKVLGAVSVNFIDSANFFDSAPFSVWVFDNPNNLSEASWYEKYWFYPFIWGEYTPKDSQKYGPQAEIKIGDKLGHFTIIDYQPGNPALVLIPLNKKMYLFRTIYYDDKETDLMMNTFRFLE